MSYTNEKTDHEKGRYCCFQSNFTERTVHVNRLAIRQPYHYKYLMEGRKSKILAHTQQQQLNGETHKVSMGVMGSTT